MFEVLFDNYFKEKQPLPKIFCQKLHELFVGI